jgi:hypothetical protein
MDSILSIAFESRPIEQDYSQRKILGWWVQKSGKEVDLEEVELDSPGAEEISLPYSHLPSSKSEQ